MQFPHGDRSRGVDPLLGDPVGEFGQVDGLQVGAVGVVEAALAGHDLVVRLASVEGAVEGVDEGDCAAFFLAAHALAGCFALTGGGATPDAFLVAIGAADVGEGGED